MSSMCTINRTPPGVVRLVDCKVRQTTVNYISTFRPRFALTLVAVFPPCGRCFRWMWHGNGYRDMFTSGGSNCVRHDDGSRFKWRCEQLVRSTIGRSHSRSKLFGSLKPLGLWTTFFFAVLNFGVIFILQYALTRKLLFTLR